ncbi:hypothetical protein DFR67_12670 [Williamsia limnetica]|uniref:Uncharacterized protein n=1 Tax=Williamsia limnetica TaxID=882452 RepID=A0A318RAQ4_WILLI|nr:hypothetical protein [Williamsia limnetica]PYE12062.1 hypothetical protein DFR67_12670 [Williamsia limnetica]
MASSRPDVADVEQARYLAAELERWVDRLAEDVERESATSVIAAKRAELYDVQRQLKALRETFPQAFRTR